MIPPQPAKIAHRSGKPMMKGRKSSPAFLVHYITICSTAGSASKEKLGLPPPPAAILRRNNGTKETLRHTVSVL
jgi:hypothetical protein